nr:MAG TPA: hypothetical protein [Caudoviricetes sp.]
MARNRPSITFPLSIRKKRKSFVRFSCIKDFPVV